MSRRPNWPGLAVIAFSVVWALFLISMSRLAWRHFGGC